MWINGDDLFDVYGGCCYGSCVVFVGFVGFVGGYGFWKIIWYFGI